MLSLVIHILEAAFLIGMLGSAVVVVWVAIEDAIAVRDRHEKETAESATRAAA